MRKNQEKMQKPKNRWKNGKRGKNCEKWGKNRKHKQKPKKMMKKMWIF